MVGKDRERRRALVVERAASPPSAAATCELDSTAQQLDKVGNLADLINAFRIDAWHGLSLRADVEKWHPARP
jgi:hypothetical protein